MNRFIRILCLLLCAVFLAPAARAATIGAASGGGGGGGGSVPTIRRAAAVEEREQPTGMEAFSGNQVLGTVLGLASAAVDARRGAQAMRADCAPSTNDINFVNELVRSYAAMGRQSAAVMLAGLEFSDTNNCGVSVASGVNRTYQEWLTSGVHIEPGATCFERFRGTGNEGRIWDGYPMASMGRGCERAGCADANRVVFTNIHEIFAAMSWRQEDLLSGEVSGFARMLSETERCNPRALERRTRAQRADFVQGTIATLGQPQQGPVDNMAHVTNIVSGLGGRSGGLDTGLQLLPAATQMFMRD